MVRTTTKTLRYTISRGRKVNSVNATVISATGCNSLYFGKLPGLLLVVQFIIALIALSLIAATRHFPVSNAAYVPEKVSTATSLNTEGTTPDFLEAIEETLMEALIDNATDGIETTTFGTAITETDGLVMEAATTLLVILGDQENSSNAPADLEQANIEESVALPLIQNLSDSFAVAAETLSSATVLHSEPFFLCALTAIFAMLVILLVTYLFDTVSSMIIPKISIVEVVANFVMAFLSLSAGAAEIAFTELTERGNEYYRFPWMERTDNILRFAAGALALLNSVLFFVSFVLARRELAGPKHG